MFSKSPLMFRKFLLLSFLHVETGCSDGLVCVSSWNGVEVDTVLGEMTTSQDRQFEWKIIHQIRSLGKLNFTAVWVLIMKY